MLALYGVLFPILSSYQSFSYEKNALNTLYFERKQVKLGSEEWREDMSNKLDGRKPFVFGYWSYVSIKLVSCLCCCFTTRWSRDQKSWYARKKNLLEKFEIAREKFNSEVDLHSMLKLLRIARFMQRLNLKRWQGKSVSYFRRYTIEDYEVERTKQKQELEEGKKVYMKKQEEAARIEAEKEMILEQIEPRESHIDKRILSETTGRRLNEADYQDESQSEGDVDVILDDMLGYSPRQTMPEGENSFTGAG